MSIRTGIVTVGFDTLRIRNMDYKERRKNALLSANLTRSSATVKSTARPSCVVCVLYDIYQQTINRSTANQPLLRDWPRKLANSAK